jgi:hypothetical protein
MEKAHRTLQLSGNNPKIWSEFKELDLSGCEEILIYLLSATYEFLGLA